MTNPSSPPKDRRYALTPHGEDLASVLYETAPLLDIGYVWGLISAQRQKALDRAALSKAKVSVAPQSENPKPETSLNPQQLLVLRTLGGLEELSDAEIYARTSSHFAYEGFVNVALSRLEQLHLVRREYRVHDGELCWACTAEGYGTIRREAFVVIRESAVVMQEPTYSKPEKVKRIPEPRLNSKHLALLQTLSDREELTVAEIFSYVSGTFSHQGFVSVTLRSLAGYGYARSHYKQRNGRTDLCWSCTAEGLSALGFGLIRQRAEAAQDCVV